MNKKALGKTQAIPQKNSYEKTEEEIDASIKKMWTISLRK
jgi:hypothetical protein